jgi:tRNA/tmRNA/rRNA uracil-C5-methylase (TrmA/RlmC/RlmD family)
VRVLEELTAADRDLLLQFARARRTDVSSARRLRNDCAADRRRAARISSPQFDVTVRFQPNDFLQVNGELNAMVARAVELLRPLR